MNGSKEKNGIVPIMGRVTINGTVAQFSCKRSIAKELWDAKGNRAKGKSREARETNLALDNIKEFAVYLSTEAGLRNGTIWEKCMWLKGVVMRAHFNGLIPRNPFAQFHISPNVKEREFLTEDELKAVMTHEFADPKLAYIRVQTAQDGRTVPSETAGHSLADNRALPTVPRKQPRVPQPELLVHLQAVEENDTGMWCE